MNKQTLELSSQPVAKALELMRKCIPSSPMIPVLAGIRIMTKGDGVAVFMASDSVGEITLKLPCEASEELDFVVLGNILPHLANRFASDTIELTLKENRAQLTSGRARWSMPFVPGEEWPQMQRYEKDAKWGVELDADALSKAISAVAPVAPRNNANLNYNGVCFIPSRDLDIVATNGHCLHHASIQLGKQDPPQNMEVIVPQTLIRQLVTIIKGAGEKVRLIFGFGNLTVLNEGGDMEFYIRGIDFKFPPWRQIKPGTQHRVELVTPDFMALLQRISVQETDAFIQLNFRQSKLLARCTANNGQSWATDSIPLVSPSPGLYAEACFALNYLYDAVKGCDSDLITLSFSEDKEQRPALFQGMSSNHAFVFSAILAQRLAGAPEAKPEAKPEAEPEAEPEAKPEAEPEAKPEAEPEAKPEAKPAAEPEAMPEAMPESDGKTNQHKDSPSSPPAGLCE